MNKFNEGFVAITSAIIISILLLAITLSLGFSGFFGRFNILDSESKERSLALAEGCGDAAALKIAKNPAYNPSNEIVAVGLDQCTIVSVATSGSHKIIKTQAEFNKAYTTLKITIDPASYKVVSWEECADLGAC